MRDPDKGWILISTEFSPIRFVKNNVIHEMENNVNWPNFTSIVNKVFRLIGLGIKTHISIS